MWYPDTPRHYTIPSSFARHYFLESDRTIHGRQRAFQVAETETGILQVIYLKSNWVLFVFYFQYGSHASCLRKEGRNRTEFFFFFFFGISPLYTSGFCCSNSIQFLSCSTCSLKRARIKDFNVILLRFAAKSLRSRNLLQIWVRRKLASNWYDRNIVVFFVDQSGETSDD